MTTGPLKIVSLEAENIKRLRAVHITPDPDGHLVLVSGRNAQGKSSVLDSIWLALGGSTASKTTPRPVRDGEEHAHVTLDLGELVVTRTWKGDKSKLTVASADGAQYKSPQQMLDGLIGHLSFDPLAFIQGDDKTQRATLLSLVDLPFDLEQLDEQRRQVFEERTGVNRALGEADAQLAGMPKPPAGLPDDEISASDLLGRIRQAETEVRTWRDAHAAVTAADLEVERCANALQVALTEQDRAKGALADLPKAVADPDALAAQLADLEQTNAAVRAARARTEVQARRDRLATKADEQTDALAMFDKRRADALAAAAMPLEGLGVDDGGVTYLGAPLKQASGAEQLRVSIAMAMALNPSIRVIRITDGSLLDSTNLELIASMAAEHGFQIWVERVDESGQVGVVIEDGAVVATVAAGAA